MRLAVLIIGLALAGIVGMQSFAILSHPFAPDELTGPASLGIVVALLLTAGAAFAMGVPKVSIGCFGFGALLLFSAGQTTPFTDLTTWSVVAVGLAGLSIFADREARPIGAHAQPSATANASFAPVPRTTMTAHVDAPAAKTPQAGESSVVEQLERLGRLKASGALSDEEFTAMKADLLARKAN